MDTFLHQTTFTPGTLYNFTLDTFYTRHLLHQTPVTPDSFYNKQLLRQAPFTPETFYPPTHPKGSEKDHWRPNPKNKINKLRSAEPTHV